MSLPPAHISIKRRRQDDPVELLYLDNDRHQTKRQFTDYCFQRVTGEVEPPKLSPLPAIGNIRDNHRTASSQAASGIPTVRATSPGAEIREEAERRVAQKALRHRYVAGEEPSKPKSPALNDSKQTVEDDPPKRHNKPVAPLRQFRLSPWPRSSHSNDPSGIHKRKTARKNYLATFVERSTASRLGPIFLDKIGNNESGRAVQEGRVKRPVADQSAEKIDNAVPRQMLKAGQSMHDHPSTWDYDSDQLAEELAAFALEISQSEEQEKLRSKTSETHDVTIKDTVMNLDEYFIYDTYIRVPVGDEKSGGETTNDVGLLVIEDEDQELWQTFVESDDDSEWDDEDPDSNAEDNPANEYPDDEIDSDDEHGYNAYQHRKSASDDEEYDLNEP